MMNFLSGLEGGISKRFKRKSKTPRFLDEFLEQSKTNKKKSETWYYLEGVPFSREDTRDRYLTDFQGIVSSTEEGTLYARFGVEKIHYQNQIYTAQRQEFFIRTSLPPQSFSAVPVESPLTMREKVVENRMRYVKLSDGSLARVFVAYRYPLVLPEGFLYSTFHLLSELAITWKKIQAQKALSLIESAMTRKSSGRGLKESMEIENLRQLAGAIRAGSEILDFQILFVVKGQNEEELNEKSKALILTLKTFGVSVDAPPFYQANLYALEPFTSFPSLIHRYTDAESFRVLFPLIKETHVDADGVFLGFSGTGDPITFNPYRRYNYLSCIIGETGSGKSMTTKILLSRLHSKTGIPIYGVDPESEYVKVASKFGSTGIDLVEGTRLGLDPLKMGVEPARIADLLSDVYKIPPDLKNLLRAEIYKKKPSDVFELVEKCPSELRKYLEGLLVPPDSLLFDGTPPDLSSPMIFGLRNVRSKHFKLLAASTLTLYLSSKATSKCVLFVDEGWLFKDSPSVMAYLEDTARRGRKYGIALFFITQRVEDVASTQEGRTLLEQAATAILLREEPPGAACLRDVYKLTESETSFLTQCTPGEGILKVGEYRIRLSVAPTEEELKLFSTRVM